MSDWVHFNDTRPKARKRYRCELCGFPIEPGTIHLARRGVWEGRLFTGRMHLDCEQMTRDDNWSDDDWENRDEQEFREELATWKEARGGK